MNPSVTVSEGRPQGPGAPRERGCKAPTLFAPTAAPLAGRKTRLIEIDPQAFSSQQHSPDRAAHFQIVSEEFLNYLGMRNLNG